MYTKDRAFILFVVVVFLVGGTLGEDAVEGLGNHSLTILTIQEPLDHGLDTLGGILAHHVDLDVDMVAKSLCGHDNTGLGIGDHHDREGALDIVDINNGQRGTVEADESLGDDVVHKVLVFLRDLEDKCDGVAVVGSGENGDSCVDVALDHVAAEAGVSVHCALQVHSVTFLQ